MQYLQRFCYVSHRGAGRRRPGGRPAAGQEALLIFFAGPVGQGRVLIFFAGPAGQGRVLIFFAGQAGQGRVLSLFSQARLAGGVYCFFRAGSRPGACTDIFWFPGLQKSVHGARTDFWVVQISVRVLFFGLRKK